MRAGKRSILMLVACMLCALVGVFAALPTPALAGGGSVALLASAFPDADLRNLLRGPSYDLDQDGFLDDGEIAAVTQLDLSHTTVADLTGISWLTSLRTLTLGGTMRFDSLVLNGMPSLETVWCDNFPLLGSLSISDCPKLSRLSVSNCSLKELDLRDCPSMNEVNANGNQLLSVAFADGAPLQGVSVASQREWVDPCFPSSDGGRGSTSVTSSPCCRSPALTLPR